MRHLHFAPPPTPTPLLLFKRLVTSIKDIVVSVLITKI